MQNEALHIVILLNKSQDCELKLFRIFLTLFSIRLANMNLRLESESASRRKFAQLVDGDLGSLLPVSIVESSFVTLSES